LLAYEPARYVVRQEPTHFQVEAEVSFEVLRCGEIPTPLFSTPVHLQTFHLDSLETNLALVTVTNRLSLYSHHPGTGSLRIAYRVPIENRAGKKRAQIPVFSAPSGSVRLESTRDDFEITSGSVWTKGSGDHSTIYDIGVAGEDPLVVEWRDQGGDARFAGSRPGEATSDFYGIGLTRAQNLTVINSDGSCTHLVEYELPAFQKEEFRLRLPVGARLISASINGTELTAPNVEDRLCRIRLPGRAPGQIAHRLSFRLAYPPLRLGFLGSFELALPEVFHTAGTLEWVVALPDGFEAQVISSGLETQRTAPDLSAFGDYGRILKSHLHTSLAKTLAPPGAVNLNLKYRQLVPVIYEGGPETRASSGTAKD
jgi:hypothetical protein